MLEFGWVGFLFEINGGGLTFQNKFAYTTNQNI